MQPLAPQPSLIPPKLRMDLVAEPADRDHPGTSHEERLYPALAKGYGTWMFQAEVRLKAELQRHPPTIHWSACKELLSLDMN